MTIAVSGFLAAVLALALWFYLRSRTRHLLTGVEYLKEFKELSAELIEHEMPDRLCRNLVVFSHVVGTGYVTRRLFKQLLEGHLAEPLRREIIQGRRLEWEGFHSSTRILYVRCFFSGLRADSYFAGTVRGTLFRRAVFYLNADPAEIAHTVDTMETKILLLGVQEVMDRSPPNDNDSAGCKGDLVSA